MIHDQEDLPRQRTPSLGLGAAAYMNQPIINPQLEGQQQQQQQQRGRQQGLHTPQSAPPNISLLPPTPTQSQNELSEEAAALLAQKPSPPAPVSGTAIVNPMGTDPNTHPHGHFHRPPPQQRPQNPGQVSGMDHSLHQLQMQVPSGFRSGMAIRKSPAPDNPIGDPDPPIDSEQPPPLVPIQLPNSTNAPHGYTKDPHDVHYNLEPRMLQQHMSYQPPHPAARPSGPAFAPRQGSAPPRFGGSYAPTPVAPLSNGGGDRDRVRSTSASGGPPIQPTRKISNITDPGIRPSRSRSAAHESATDSPFNPISSEASIPSSTLRQQQLKAMSSTYSSRDSRETDSPCRSDKTSSRGKLTMFKSDSLDKSDSEVIKVLRRSNAYAAEKPASPKRQYTHKHPRSEVGMVPQPFGTPRSPPVSPNTLEEAQVTKT